MLRSRAVLLIRAQHTVLHGAWRISETKLTAVVGDWLRKEFWVAIYRNRIVSVLTSLSV